MKAAQFYVLDRSNVHEKSKASDSAVCAYYNKLDGKSHLSHVNGVFCESKDCPFVHQQYPHWPELEELYKEEIESKSMPLFMNYAQFEDGCTLQIVVDTYPLFLNQRKAILDAIQKLHGKSTEAIGFCLACGKLGKTRMQRMKKEANKISESAYDLEALCKLAAVNGGFASQWMERTAAKDLDAAEWMDMQASRERDYRVVELARPQLPDRSKEFIKEADMYAFNKNLMTVKSLRPCESSICRNPTLKNAEFDPGYVCFKVKTDQETYINAIFPLKGPCESLFCNNCGGTKSMNQIGRCLLHVNKTAVSSGGNNWDKLMDMHYRMEEYGMSVMIKQIKYKVVKFEFPISELEEMMKDDHE